MLTEIVIWMFLFIFFSCAIIVIGSIPNWIKVDEKYKKWLFSILIVEVIGCVILFGKEAFFSYNTPQKKFCEILLNPEYRWYWQYSRNNWKTIVTFENVRGNEYKFSGETFYLEKGKDESPVIIMWEGKDLVKIPEDAETINVKAQRYWTEAAAEIYTQLTNQVNKKTDVQINLSLGVSL